MVTNNDEPIDLPTLAAIAEWGRTQRMPADLAAAIFDEIVATPAPDLTPARPVRDTRPAEESAWWRQHAASLAATMVTSTRWSPAA